MGSATYMLAKQGWVLFRVFLHSTPKERPPLFTYEQQACVCQIAGVTSNITAHHIVFTAIKRSLRSRVEVPCIFAFTGKPACIDTTDTETQTQRLFASKVSYLRYA